jgi:hypothetical protein
MANLTLSIDDKVLQAARVRAVKEGTSVNEICRKAIENFARASGRSRVERFDALMARLDAERPSGPVPAPWRNRQEMYEELLAPARAQSAKGTRRR